MTIRRAAPLDAVVIAKHRAAVWQEVGEWSSDDLALQVPIWEAFFRAHLADATHVGFIAEEDGGVVPRPRLGSDRSGRVHSVYVVPAARRRGIARTIMEHLLRYAREAMLISLTLHSSDEARALYVALGFKRTDEMLLPFTYG